MSKAKPFPEGSRTLPCGSCNGSGIDRLEMTRLQSSRTTATARASALSCRRCSGVGRLLDLRPTCRHAIALADCAECTQAIGGPTS